MCLSFNMMFNLISDHNKTWTRLIMEHHLYIGLIWRFPATEMKIRAGIPKMWKILLYVHQGYLS